MQLEIGSTPASGVVRRASRLTLTLEINSPSVTPHASLFGARRAEPQPPRCPVETTFLNSDYERISFTPHGSRVLGETCCREATMEISQPRSGWKSHRSVAS
jgi:hypothetical protein